MSKQLISKAIGIDLGTTNSAVAIMNPTDTKLIMHRDATTRRETTPSCVWKEPKSGEIVVGRKAFSRIGTTPSPIRSIKRQMGRQERVRLVNEMVTPEEVSAHILREMKRQIEEDVARFQTDGADWVVDRAIITVPAYFDMPQIEATRKAGELAGLHVLELLHEPTAAACYHCFRTNTQNGVFMVYDFGGGTFDVSILRCTAGAFKVLGISGHNYLGGDDLDAVLAKHLLQQLQPHYSLNLDIEHDAEDKLRFDKLKLLMEGVKKVLSLNDDFLLRDTASLRDKQNESVEIESQFERKEIEALMAPIVERTIPYCHKALEAAQEEAGVTLANVDAIILAGGSTHIPLVRELVRKTFCAAPDANEPRAKCTEPLYENVDSIVAQGAALRAAAVGGLVIDTPERAVRVSFQGMGTTSTQRANIGGQVGALDTQLDLAGGYVRLTFPDLDFEEECNLSDSGMFGFTRVPLQSEAENLMRIEVYNADRMLLATVGRSVTQGAYNGDAGDTDVLSKPISLEVAHAGHIVRQTLIQALQPLPYSATYSFRHPGGTDYIRFALHQYHRKIKEIRIEVPETTPRDTPINLRIDVDRLAMISCKGSIGTTPFQFVVEAPRDRVVTADDIAALDKQLQALSPEQQRIIKREVDEARVAASEALAFGEKGQAEHEIERAEALVDRVVLESKLLQPPREELQKLVQDSIVFIEYAAKAAASQGTPFDTIAIANSIEEQRRNGEMAFEAGDQQAYTNAYKMLTSIYSHMASLIYRDVPPLVQADQCITYAKQVITEARPLAERRGRRDLLARLGDMSRRLDRLARDVNHDELAVLREAAQLSVQVEQMLNVLKGGTPGDLPESLGGGQ